MMRSGRASSPDVESSFVDIEGALAALSAEGLRELILDILPWLEEPALGRLINGLMDRAARGDSGWAPDGPTGRDVASIVSFADAAARDGYADPWRKVPSPGLLETDYSFLPDFVRTWITPSAGP